ncbi:MAG: efflux RND transporter periplasmic adaptor subunit [Betaproteobacteria bacterium]
MNVNTAIIVAAVVAAAGAAGFGLYRVGMNQGMKMANAPAVEASTAVQGEPKAANAERKILYWHDPMTPGARFDKPGKSPYMDMQLVPVYESDAADEGKTAVSSRVQQNLGIRTAEVVKGNLSSSVTAVGSVAYNEHDVALVQTRNTGFVERLHVRAPLDPVRKGQPLVDLYVPDWVAAQEEFFSVARMAGRGIEGLADGARQRMRLAGMSDDQIRAVETSGKVQPRFTITAPIGGVVSELLVREGMTVMAGASLFRINGLGTIWVNAEVPENVSGRVRPGVAAEASTPSVPGKIFKGQVSRILPEVNPVTRTIKARVELDNPSGQLVPGMFATITFKSAARDSALLVPTEAVIQTGTRTVVMVAHGDGKFSAVAVETGAEANGLTEVRKGLQAGQKIVVSGQFLIDSEASLRASATRMSEPAAADPGKPAGLVHRAQGTVDSVDKDEIMLSHGPVPSLKWVPMTMGFKLPPQGVPANVKAGTVVTFEFRQGSNGAYEITSIAPAATASTQAGGGKIKGVEGGTMSEPMTMPPKPGGAPK